MGKSYSSVTAIAGDQFVARMQQAKVLQLPGICLCGSWRNRRFEVAEFKPANTIITSPVFDVQGLHLLVPVEISSTQFVSACRSFGAKVERAYRDSHDYFERASDLSARIHVVHAYHHVALCQFKGPWPNTPDTAEVRSCTRCSDRAKLTPAHRVRYHPCDEVAPQTTAT